MADRREAGQLINRFRTAALVGAMAITGSPTERPSTASASTPDCLPTSQVSEWAKNSTVGGLIHKLNEAYDGSDGRIGQQSHFGPWRLENPGRAGASVLWTDTLHQGFKTLSSNENVEDNVFEVKRQGSWGTVVFFTGIETPEPGRSAELCDPITDLQEVFPGAKPARD